MQPRILATTTALALACVAVPAFSVDKGFYLGAALGQSESGLRNGSFNFKDRNQGYKLIAGIRPLSLLAVELNYVDLGTASVAGAQAKTKAADGFALVFLPIPLVDVYGKLGYVSWKTDASAPTLSLRSSGSDLAYGAGVQVHFASLSARLEYEAFDVQAAAKPTFLSLGLTYTFL
jgi:Outer membrane protein beta-barrel domain